jgi:hypothetical protein
MTCRRFPACPGAWAVSEATGAPWVGRYGNIFVRSVNGPRNVMPGWLLPE